MADPICKWFFNVTEEEYEIQKQKFQMSVIICEKRNMNFKEIGIGFWGNVKVSDLYNEYWSYKKLIY